MGDASARVGGGGVDTKKVVGRRSLRFADLDECLAEVARLREAERAGRLRGLGNWTLGQTLGHLAAWIEYAYVGYPMKKPAWVLRVLGPLMVGWLLKNPWPAGVRLPGAGAGTYGQEAMSTEAGEARLRGAFERLRRERATVPSPMFGLLPQEKLVLMHLRHAELHLGFWVPSAG